MMTWGWEINTRTTFCAQNHPPPPQSWASIRTTERVSEPPRVRISVLRGSQPLTSRLPSQQSTQLRVKLEACYTHHSICEQGRKGRPRLPLDPGGSITPTSRSLAGEKRHLRPSSSQNRPGFQDLKGRCWHGVGRGFSIASGTSTGHVGRLSAGTLEPLRGGAAVGQIRSVWRASHRQRVLWNQFLSILRDIQGPSQESQEGSYLRSYHGLNSTGGCRA